jgi:hypothetical protein
MEKTMSKIRLTEIFKERLCEDILQEIKEGNNTFYKLKKALIHENSRIGEREIKSALRFGCKEWLVHGVKTRYKFILEGKTYSYKVV